MTHSHASLQASSSGFEVVAPRLRLMAGARDTAGKPAAIRTICMQGREYGLEVVAPRLRLMAGARDTAVKPVAIRTICMRGRE